MHAAVRNARQTSLRVAFLHIEEKRRTERVKNQASLREKLSPAESSFGKEIFEVPPGAGRMKKMRVDGPVFSSPVRFTHVTCIK